MNSTKLDRALSALSGRPCTYAYVLQNRTRFYLGLGAALAVGLATGVLIHQWLVGTTVVVALTFVTAPLFDRRIVGLNANGVVQAKCVSFGARPTELLAPLEFTEVQVLGNRALDTAAFRINGTTFLGNKGSSALAGALQQKQA